MAHRGTRGSWARRSAAVCLAVALAAGGCSGGDDEAGPTTSSTVPLAGEIELTLDRPDICEHIGGGGCLLPFPSDHLTVADATTETGRRVAIDPAATPVNVDGVAVDPTEWNRSDGFSSGSPLLLVLPGLDPAASGLGPITDIGASLDDDAPIVLLDTVTGERVPHWAELDTAAVGAGEDQPTAPPAVAGEETTLIIRPARNLRHGHRHAVGVRGLVDGDGEALPVADGFRAYRDRLGTDVEAVEARRPAMEAVFSDLGAAGVDRGDLQMAWDLTVRSTADVTGRLLAMRDDAFDSLGDEAPAFSVEEVTAEGAPPGAQVVSGLFTAPSYLTGDGGPGSTLANGDDPDGVPTRSGEREARFICVVPTAPAAPGAGVLYGHGLLGGAEEALSVGALAVPLLGITVCGADWIGMAREDVPAILGVLGDFSEFRIVPDRLQQAHLEFLLLGRLLAHPDGFASDPAFAGADGEPVLDGDVLFVGSSQGGILGGATSAVATDWDRAALLVPAQNYSTLLERSVNFDQFATSVSAAYPDPVDRQILVALAQQLWDRGENNGYSQNLTSDPLPGAEAKTVMLLASFGDHQVANVATDVLARTADIPLRDPGLAPGRSPDEEPFWGIERIDDWPRSGSQYVMWDFGTPPPPTANIPPRAGDDPHGSAAEEPQALLAIVAFLTEDEWGDPCPSGEACAS